MASACHVRRRRVAPSATPPSTSRVAAAPTGNAQGDKPSSFATSVGAATAAAAGGAATGAGIFAATVPVGAVAAVRAGTTAAPVAAVALTASRRTDLVAGVLAGGAGDRAAGGAVVATAGSGVEPTGAVTGVSAARVGNTMVGVATVGAAGDGLAEMSGAGCAVVGWTASCACAIPVESINMAEIAMKLRGDAVECLVMTAKRDETIFRFSRLDGTKNYWG